MKKLALLILLTASPALAHARLSGSDPAPDSKVKSVKTIKLSFSERLEPAFSGASLSDGGGKPIPVPSSVAGSTITLLPMSLKPGRYKVEYHGVGHDTHRVAGSFFFDLVP